MQFCFCTFPMRHYAHNALAGNLLAPSGLSQLLRTPIAFPKPGLMEEIVTFISPKLVSGKLYGHLVIE